MNTLTALTTPEQPVRKKSARFYYAAKRQIECWGKAIAGCQPDRRSCPGVWWFECEGNSGYVVSDALFSLEALPCKEFFEIATVSDGTRLFAFDEGGDAELLEWFSPALRQAVYRLGRVSTRGATESTWTPEFYQRFPTFEAYSRHVTRVARRFYPEIFEEAAEAAAERVAATADAKGQTSMFIEELSA